MASGMAVYLVGQCEKRKKGGKKKDLHLLESGLALSSGLAKRREERP